MHFLRQRGPDGGILVAHCPHWAVPARCFLHLTVLPCGSVDARGHCRTSTLAHDGLGILTSLRCQVGLATLQLLRGWCFWWISVVTNTQGVSVPKHHQTYQAGKTAPPALPQWKKPPRRGRKTLRRCPLVARTPHHRRRWRWWWVFAACHRPGTDGIWPDRPPPALACLALRESRYLNEAGHRPAAGVSER